ncbi:DNA repair helicase XPB [Cohnella thailandensis]|uniref:DNA 3'-5' helicase n=1 Tax=Cohnella thailandensis TaxID=557557 RepID=A0A841SVX8_9BACL|nr:DNA repair helicase XPB [Cohnella thailandensis]MBB6636443.1 DEAD/DEAH box helicase [Cohnella thailandensis]MBP1973586.1 DNA excision repair protein ERCC-3 [Cohnella thailandensis]
MSTVSRPLLIQSDGTIMMQDHHPEADAAQELLREIAELIKRPGEWHTYRVTSVSLWNAAASGWTAETVLERLGNLARYGLPALLVKEIRHFMGRYGSLRLRTRGDELELAVQDPGLLKQLMANSSLEACWLKKPDGLTVAVKKEARGWLKRELIALGYPVMDEAGYRLGEALPVKLKEKDEEGRTIRLRDYQENAVRAFALGKNGAGGSGVVVLPCGAGKTWVGMGALAKLQCETLILTSNSVSVSQWVRELLRNTTLTENEVGEYTGDRKNVKPVTVATYQILTHRKSKGGAYPHWKLFVDRNWGLIIYDEVHLLPAPVFRMTADLQATRRLGLTATLVREDGREGDVFALIGPKSYDAPWRSMERQGWIAKPSCLEVRVPLAPNTAFQYREATKRQKHRIAGENPLKIEAVRRLLSRHPEQPTLIIGQYLDQLNSVARGLRLPIITGSTPQSERQKLFDRFNRGEISVLAVSKVANFAVDLPDAAIAIQISGSFGSRQEEAQRLGRILRPKRDGQDVYFYSLISDETDEIEFARRRQRFLLEQGYEYEIDWLEEEAIAGEEAMT